jgi:hypothetical protein
MLILEVLAAPEGSMPQVGTRLNVMGMSEHTLGRGRHADLRLEDSNVSRRQFRFLPSASGWGIEDLNSRNGTKVNGQKVRRLQPLYEDDRLAFCGFIMNVNSVSQPIPEEVPGADETQLAELMLEDGEVAELVAVSRVEEHASASMESYNAADSFDELEPCELSASELRFDQLAGASASGGDDLFFDAAAKFVENG